MEIPMTPREQAIAAFPVPFQLELAVLLSLCLAASLFLAYAVQS
jgi:hypothetical protein